MAKLSVYNFLTLNGFYKGPGGDIKWAKNDNKEESDFAADRLKGNNILLFGRATYDMMVTYWPTEMAMKNNPEAAKGMNAAEKIVFSSTLKKAEWNNTRIIKKDIIKEMKNLKETSSKDMTLLGSGSIVTQFAESNIIDEYQFMIYPVAIGEGTPAFEGIDKKLELELTGTKTFKSGALLLYYKPAKQ